MDKPPLSINTRQHNGALVVELVGEGGIAGADVLQTQLARLCAQRPPNVVLDLSQFDFISSLVIGALAGFQRAMQRSGCTVRVAGIQPMVKEALRRSRTESLFTFFDTVDAAAGAASQ